LHQYYILTSLGSDVVLTQHLVNPIPTYIDCSETPLDWSSGLAWWNYSFYNVIVGFSGTFGLMH
jgi:hypothetical protein